MPAAARLGVCAWSLAPASVDELVAACERLGLSAVQLPLKVFHRRGRLRPGWDEAATLAALRHAGITSCSGMFATRGEDYSTLATIRATGGVVSDARWPENLALATEDAARAQRLGLDLVSFHAGFLPERADDPRRATMLARVAQVAERFAEQGVALALETGQESAATLHRVLADLDRPGLGVNFDAANMILYGMGRPEAALAELAPWVRQLHVKDAVAATRPGAWGEDVVVGTGAVRWEDLFVVLAQAGRVVDCLIEREAGDDREGDVARARDRVAALVAGLAERAR